MSKSNQENIMKLNRRQALLLSATAGASALVGNACGSRSDSNTAMPKSVTASCNTPHTDWEWWFSRLCPALRCIGLTFPLRQ